MNPYLRFPKHITAGFYSTFAILLFGVLFTLNVNAKSLTEWIEEVLATEPRIKEIVFIVGRNEGQPTKEIHDEFWKLITGLMHEEFGLENKDLETIGPIFHASVSESMAGQKEFWRSIYMSAKTGKVYKTEKFSAWRKLGIEAGLTPDYLRRQDEMLSAAASGIPYTVGNETVIISAELADYNLNNFAAVEQRIRKLSNHIW